MNALQFFRVSRVVISTLPETKSGWLRADLIERVRRYAACPVEHVVATAGDAVSGELNGESDGSREHRPRSTHHAEEHHGPIEANRSSRVDPPTLGMLLFIISEIMIFGAFFTAYFFIRIAQGDPWPAPGTTIPVGRRRLQHRDPDLLVLHPALGGDLDQARQPHRPARRDPLHAAAGR